jgi:hypothetical protein
LTAIWTHSHKESSISTEKRILVLNIDVVEVRKAYKTQQQTKSKNDSNHLNNRLQMARNLNRQQSSIKACVVLYKDWTNKRL